MDNTYCTPLEIPQIEQNFAEINPAMSRAEAIVEANRCLYCYDAAVHARVPDAYRRAVVHQKDRDR